MASPGLDTAELRFLSSVPCIAYALLLERELDALCSTTASPLRGPSRLYVPAVTPTLRSFVKAAAARYSFTIEQPAEEPPSVTPAAAAAASKGRGATSSAAAAAPPHVIVVGPSTAAAKGPALHFADFYPGGLTRDELLANLATGVTGVSSPSVVAPTADTSRMDVSPQLQALAAQLGTESALHLDANGLAFTLDHGVPLATHTHLLVIEPAPSSSRDMAIASFHLWLDHVHRPDIRWPEGAASGVVVMSTIADAADVWDRYEDEEGGEEENDNDEILFRLRPVNPSVSCPSVEDHVIRRVRAQLWTAVQAAWRRRDAPGASPWLVGDAAGTPPPPAATSSSGAPAVCLSGFNPMMSVEEVCHSLGDAVSPAVARADLMTDGASRRRKLILQCTTVEATRALLELDGQKVAGFGAKHPVRVGVAPLRLTSSSTAAAAAGGNADSLLSRFVPEATVQPSGASKVAGGAAGGRGPSKPSDKSPALKPQTPPLGPKRGTPGGRSPPPADGSPPTAPPPTDDHSSSPPAAAPSSKAPATKAASKSPQVAQQPAAAATSLQQQGAKKTPSTSPGLAASGTSPAASTGTSAKGPSTTTTTTPDAGKTVEQPAVVATATASSSLPSSTPTPATTPAAKPVSTMNYEAKEFVPKFLQQGGISPLVGAALPPPPPPSFAQTVGIAGGGLLPPAYAMTPPLTAATPPPPPPPYSASSPPMHPVYVATPPPPPPSYGGNGSFGSAALPAPLPPPPGYVSPGVIVGQGGVPPPAAFLPMPMGTPPYHVSHLPRGSPLMGPATAASMPPPPPPYYAMPAAPPPPPPPAVGVHRDE